MNKLPILTGNSLSFIELLNMKKLWVSLLSIAILVSTSSAFGQSLTVRLAFGNSYTIKLSKNNAPLPNIINGKIIVYTGHDYVFQYQAQPTSGWIVSSPNPNPTTSSLTIQSIGIIKIGTVRFHKKDGKEADVMADVTVYGSPDRNKGNNGLGNGTDPQPQGNPPINDGAGTTPGNPENKGGTKHSH